MRCSAVVLLVVLQAAPGHATKPSLPTWPEAGRCLANDYDARLGCVLVDAADAEAIRLAVLRRLDPATLKKRPVWREARRLATQPVNDFMIGGYRVEGFGYEGFAGEVVRLIGVERSADGVESGFRITVGRLPAGGWRVLHLEAYREPLPQTL
jgi:hypothetical protein